MKTSILSVCGNHGRRAKQYLKQWTKPVAATLVTGALSDATLRRGDPIAENVMLRHQLLVLDREVKQSQFTENDRMRLVLLAGCIQI